jgi:hypothetical protein
MYPLMDAIRSSIQDKILSLGGQLQAPQLTQGFGSTIPSLRYPIQNFPFIPQSGTIPPNAPLSPIRAGTIETVNAGMDGMLPLLLIAGLALTFMRGSRR